ncbi:hypothetical protein ncot_10800 [Nocardioides sp. JQ2195]|uniref:sensor histidine kinase n=1 Tax=Nocardioides sp. JQ2195 TaxID=2592334 RepID=UPI00143EC0E7|nr:ATP-binding protein [Nocardioides sp. JQ2195]QIX27027.1 hypothetical protein ncot_10800 [Nocardioides sp. JQ2195]
MTWWLSLARWPTFLPALFTGAWTAFFIDEPLGPAHLAVPLMAVAVLLARTRPLLPVLLLGAASLTGLVSGGRYGSLELVAGAVLLLGWVGRRTPEAWVGLLAIGLTALPEAMRDGITLRKLVVTLVVFGSFWLFGRLVRHRALAAARAVAEAERLAAADPAALARPRAEAERRHVAASAATDLRAAVHDMVSAIDHALLGTTPTVAHLRRIRERGTRTVEELRKLLLLLRAEPTSAGASSPPERSRWRVDLGLAAAAASVAAITLWQVDGWADERWVALAYAGVVAALALRRTTPLIAVALLATALALLAVQPPDDPDALLLMAAGVAAVLWELASTDDLEHRALAGIVCVAAIVLGTRFGTDGTAFIATLLLVSVTSSRAWGEPDRILQRAQEESVVLRAALENGVAEAVRRERVVIARDLHDATSHAVGIMLMQVSAAEANLEPSPDKAIAALRIAREAGDQARTASSPLLPGETGPAPAGTTPAGTTPAGTTLDGTTLGSELLALISQWRRSGLAVEARVDLPTPTSPELAGACYRVVQEALTNCARHAPGSEVSVLVARRRHHLLVQVEDTGPQGAVPSTPSGGWGLSGLRERVSASHGHFSAGPGRRGFTVTARFPLPSATRSGT